MDPVIIILDYRGGQLFGYCLNIMLYGMLTVQIYLYYIAFPHDKIITKAVVAFVYSLDTVQTVLALFDFYGAFCTSNNLNTIALGGFQWLTIPLSGSLIAAVAQLFYAHRIYILSKKKIVTSIVIILALIQLTFGLITAAVLHGSLSNKNPFDNLLSSVGWGGAGVMCDLIIAVYMSWFLSIQMRRSSRTTQVALTRIKRLLLETGLLTVLLAVLYPVLLTLVPFNAASVPGLPLGKIYSNSILVLLNNRFTIAGGRNEPTCQFEIDSYHLSRVPTREDSEHGLSRSGQVE